MKRRSPLFGKTVKRSRYRHPQGNKVAAINPVWVVSHCESNYAMTTHGGRTGLVVKYIGAEEPRFDVS